MLSENEKQNKLIQSHLHPWKIHAHKNNTTKFARTYANKNYIWNPLKWFSVRKLGSGDWGQKNA